MTTRTMALLRNEFERLKVRIRDAEPHEFRALLANAWELEEAIKRQPNDNDVGIYMCGYTAGLMERKLRDGADL